ncbi:isochorismate synthase [Euzebya tangerina]|uniref:isochorismate synthase n=1 Tax=Euzebya tangerina TaxID=591198 RepID=UPI000E322070|nr:chorismate-binding protein [Euzebya tangerina]
MTAAADTARVGGLDMLQDPGGYAFLTDGSGWAGNGVARRLEPRGPTRFVDAAEWTEDLLAPGQIAFASFTFDGEAGSAVTIPEQAVRVTDTRSRRTRLQSGKVRYAGSTITEVEWMEAVTAATAQIGGGEYDKIVLARDLHVWTDHPLDALALTARLAARFPSCMTFLHEGFVGATPELLVRRAGRDVTAVVLAGTSPPGAAAGAALLRSEKDRTEHRFALRSAVASLSPLSRELEVDEDPWLLRLDNVQHLASRIRGRMVEDRHVLDVVAALHPTAAVGAYPATAASRIPGLERMDRGRYAGPIGIVHYGGDGTFGIALRCAQLQGNRARLFSGCGIVADSLPEAELQETRLKLLAMQSVLSDQ